MAAANHIYGRIASVRMEDITGASFGLTADGHTVTVSYGADMVEATTYGDINRTFITGITDYTFTFAGYYAGLAGEKSASLIHEIVGASQGTWFDIAPSGSGSTSPGWSGCVHVESYDVEVPTDGIVAISLTLRPRSGSLSYVADASW